jgi:hypothetical protein
MGAKVQDLGEVVGDVAKQLNTQPVQENSSLYIQTQDYYINYQKGEGSAQLTYKDRLVSITFYDSDPDPRISYRYAQADQAAVAKLIAKIDNAIASMLKSKIHSTTDPAVICFFLGSRKNPESKPFNGIAKLLVEHAKAAPSHRK